MTKIVTHNTVLAHWHDLVMEAQGARLLTLEEDIESYLVFLLMRFTERPEFAESVVALDLLEGLNQSGSLRQESLRDVGDKCLLYSGLFPGRAERRRVSANYYMDVGQSAYATLALEDEVLNDLYANLTVGFPPLVDILLTIRSMSDNSLQQLLHLEEFDGPNTLQ